MTSLKPFRFEKLYFDFTLPTGEVIFFFLARTQILGWKDARLSLTVTSSRDLPIHRSLILRESVSGQSPSAYLLPGLQEIISLSESEIRVRKDTDDLSLDVVFARHPEARPIAKPLIILRGKRRILWEPVQSRSIVRGSVRLGRQTWNAPGCDGYIDRLVSDVFPLFTPVRTLYWGRLHHPEGSLVYTVIPRLRPCAVLTWSSRRGQLEFDAVKVLERGAKMSSLLGMAYPPAYSLTASSPSARVRVDVWNVAPAVETEFLGNEEIRCGIESQVIKFLARNPRGVKFFSRGHVLVEKKAWTTEIEAAPFFSEIVKFS